MRPWELGEDQPVLATIRLDAEHAPAATRQLGPTVQSRPLANGSVELVVPVVNADAFRTFLFGFLDHAELVEPASWRADIIGWLEAIEASAPSGENLVVEAHDG